MESIKVTVMDEKVHLTGLREGDYINVSSAESVYGFVRIGRFVNWLIERDFSFTGKGRYLVYIGDNSMMFTNDGLPLVRRLDFDAFRFLAKNTDDRDLDDNLSVDVKVDYVDDFKHRLNWFQRVGQFIKRVFN